MAGNIREIESTIERAVILADGDTIHTRDLPLTVRQYGEMQETQNPSEEMKDFFDPIKNRKVLPLEEIKRYVVHHALNACQGNISEAAQKLDISRSTMYRFLDLYQIETKNGVAILPEMYQTNGVMQAMNA